MAIVTPFQVHLYESSLSKNVQLNFCFILESSPLPTTPEPERTSSVTSKYVFGFVTEIHENCLSKLRDNVY